MRGFQFFSPNICLPWYLLESEKDSSMFYLIDRPRKSGKLAPGRKEPRAWFGTFNIYY